MNLGQDKKLITFDTMQIKSHLARLAHKAASFLGGPAYVAGMHMVTGGIFSYGYWGKNKEYRTKIVYSAVNLLTTKLTETSILVSKQTGNNKQLNKYYSKSASNELRKLYQVKSIQELETHPLINLLDEPNEYQSGTELLEHFWMNYEFGDGYIIPEYPGAESRKAGQPIALHSIARSRVTPQKSNDRYNAVKSYLITLHNGEQIELLPDQVIHLKKTNPFDDTLTGFDPMIPAAITVNKNEQNQIAQGAAFKNGGRGTIFSSDIGTDSTGEPFNKLPIESMNILKETMQRDYQGANNNRRMHFTNGYINAQNYGDTLAEMQLIEAEKADWKDIYTIFNIPIVLCPTGENMSYNNVEFGLKMLVTNNCISKIKKFDNKLTQYARKWYKDQTLIVNHDLTEYKELAPDLKSLKEVYGDAWYVTGNEKRLLFNYDEDKSNPMLNRYLIPSGLMDLESVGMDMETDEETGDYE